MIRTQVLHALGSLRSGGRVLVADDDTFVLVGALPAPGMPRALWETSAGLRIHVARPSDLQRVLAAPPSLRARNAMSAGWPGAQGLILPLRPGLREALPAGATVAVHQSSQPAMQELLHLLQAPLLATPLFAPKGEPVRTLADAAALLPREAYQSGIAHTGAFVATLSPLT